MTIEPYERLRFIVHSHGEQFIVDLGCHGGNGACDCAHFLSRIKPQIEQDKSVGAFLPSDKYRCPHIRFSREYLVDAVIRKIMKQFPDDETI